VVGSVRAMRRDVGCKLCRYGRHSRHSCACTRGYNNPHNADICTDACADSCSNICASASDHAFSDSIVREGEVRPVWRPRFHWRCMLSTCHVVQRDLTVVGSMRAMRRDLGCKLRRRSVARPATQPRAGSAQKFSFLARGVPCLARRARTRLPGATEARHLGEHRLSQSVSREWAPPPFTVRFTTIFPRAHNLGIIGALSCRRRRCLAPASALRCVFGTQYTATGFPRQPRYPWHGPGLAGSM